MNRIRWGQVARRRRWPGFVALVAVTVPGVALASGSRTVISVGHLSDGVNTPVIADAHGVTLYMSTGDRDGKSSCYRACAQVWKPLLAVGSLIAGKGVNRKLLNSSPRTGGKRQVTYNGHPLYLYIAYGKEPPGADGGVYCGVDGSSDPNRRHPHWLVLDPRGNPKKNVPITDCQGY